MSATNGKVTRDGQNVALVHDGLTDHCQYAPVPEFSGVMFCAAVQAKPPVVYPPPDATSSEFPVRSE